ncbi:unnamed protein product [Amoebophrya sp. A25]|nr:unnamed protein product [Amoebophrya sp. A25]|eukprot:GSA25T00014238001.1
MEMEYDFAETERVREGKQTILDERIAEMRYLCRRWEAVMRGFLQTCTTKGKRGTSGREVGAGRTMSTRLCDRREIEGKHAAREAEVSASESEPSRGSMARHVLDEMRAAAKCCECGFMGQDDHSASEAKHLHQTMKEQMGRR